MFSSIAMYNNSIKHQSFVYSQLNDQTILFQIIQFSISIQFKCQTIWPIDRTQSGVTTLGQSGPESNGSEKVHYIPQIPTDWSLAIRWFNVTFRTLVGGSFTPSVEIQSVYSTAPAEWTDNQLRRKT